MIEKNENESRVLAQMEKNTGERLVLRESNFRGHHILDLRTDFRDKAGVYHPTKKGVSLSLDQWAAVIPVLQAAIVGIENPATL